MRFFFLFALLLLGVSAHDVAAAPFNWTCASNPPTSLNGTTIPKGLSLTDAGGVVWTVQGGVVYADAKPACTSSQTVLLLYYGGKIYKQDAAKAWAVWDGTCWTVVPADPRTVLACTTPTGSGTQPFFGFAGHYWGTYAGQSATTVLDLVQQAGGGLYRVDLRTSTYALADALLAAAATRNIELLAILQSPDPSYASAFNEAKAFSSKYAGRIKYYQLSNEQDLASGAIAGDGTLPTDYNTAGYNAAKTVIQGLLDGVRAGDPNAKTIVNFTWLHYGLIQRLINDGIKFDIIGIDWYWEDITKVKGTFNLSAYIKTQFGKPLWVTEGNRWEGSTGGNEAAQATYISQTASAMCNNPDISAYIVYELLDEPGAAGFEANMGLVYNPASPKPAFNAYKQAIAGCQRTPTSTASCTPAIASCNAPPPTPTSPLVVNVMSTGARCDGATDDTAAIQRAVDRVAGTGGTVLVPAGTCMINVDRSVNLKSNMTFSMAAGAVLKAIPTASVIYHVIKIAGASNVTVIGGTLLGERHRHLAPGDHINTSPSTGGEWGMGLSVAGSQNIFVSGVVSREMWGDGFFIGNLGYGPSTNVVFCGVTADDNRRTGWAAIDGNGLVLQNSLITNTNGTDPQEGIDIEPDRGDAVSNVKILDSQFYGSASSGIGAYAAAGPVTNVTVSGNTIRAPNGRYGVALATNNTITNNIIASSFAGVGCLGGCTITGNTICAPIPIGGGSGTASGNITSTTGCQLTP